jgi:hypothetical protein
LCPRKIFKSLIFNFARDISPEWRSLKPTPCNPKIPEALLVVDKKSGTELSMSQVTLDQFN